MKDKKCMALLELKSVIFKRKNKTNKINWRIDTTEEIIGKLENTAIEVSQIETVLKNGWKIKKWKKPIGLVEHYKKGQSFNCHIKWRKKEHGTKKILKK